MSDRGVYADVIEAGHVVGQCLLIGALVPRIHLGDGLPVYFVRAHPDGRVIRFHNGTDWRLLAYPSGWPGPGHHKPGRFVYVKYDDLAFNAPLPLHDQTEEQPQ